MQTWYYNEEEHQSTSAEEEDHRKNYKAIHGNVNFMCEYCDEEAKYKPGFGGHIKLKHGRGNYPWKQCEHKVTTRYSLKRHIRENREYLILIPTLIVLFKLYKKNGT